MSNSSQVHTFREAEIRCLLNWAKAGASASIIGVSGIGKSNLFNHLFDPSTRQQYFGEAEGTDKYIFVRVNFHTMPDFSIRSVYSLILEQFELLEERLEQFNLHDEQIKQIGVYHEALLDAGDDLLKVQRYFNLAVRTLLRRSKRQLIFLFDQFEQLYQNTNPRLFASLRGLRETYKYRLSYFVFTRNSLLKLAQSDPAREEFYELVAPNVMGLKPYSYQDATHMLRRVSRRYGLPLNPSLAERLFSLTGGHAGVLRAVYFAVTQDEIELLANPQQASEMLLDKQNILTECHKIWNSITVEERRLLAAYAHPSIKSKYKQKDRQKDKEVTQQLQLKGLLTASKNPSIFSPLFKAFVLKQESLWEKPLYFDRQIRSVWVLGQPTSPLTALEFNIFDLLYERRGEVIERDELVHAGWPHAQGGVSDESINAVIARLRRKIEPQPSKPRFLKNVRGQGYRLHEE